MRTTGRGRWKPGRNRDRPSTTPEALHRLLKGDLDAVMAKATEELPVTARLGPCMAEEVQPSLRRAATAPARTAGVPRPRNHAAQPDRGGSGALAVLALIGLIGALGQARRATRDAALADATPQAD